MKVTGDTITGKQIRQLRAEDETPLTGNGFHIACDIALGVYDLEEWDDRELARQIAIAKERCAEIWNARHGAL